MKARRISSREFMNFLIYEKEAAVLEDSLEGFSFLTANNDQVTNRKNDVAEINRVFYGSLIREREEMSWTSWWLAGYVAMQNRKRENVLHATI